jgi:hypothetical protein
MKLYKRPCECEKARMLIDEISLDKEEKTRKKGEEDISWEMYRSGYGYEEHIPKLKVEGYMLYLDNLNEPKFFDEAYWKMVEDRTMREEIAEHDRMLGENENHKDYDYCKD